MSRLVRLAVLGCALLWCVAAVAQGYPSRTIKLIVPFPPGATTDAVGRVIGDYLRTKTGATVVVENMPGAAGNIGMTSAVRADPDGYTLVVVASSLISINPHLYKEARLDPVKDLAVVGIIGEIPTLFAVNKDVPAQTLPEFLALAKKDPGKYVYASAGVGTPLHLSVARLAREAKVELLHVPYRGGAPAINDLLANRANFIGIDPGPLLAHIEAGTLRPLAIAASKRVPALPNVPTVNETGITGFEDYVWWGIAAPRQTPTAILDQLNDLLRDAASYPAVKERLAPLQVQLLSPRRDEIERRIEAESKSWGAFIESAGIKIQ
jgi:tripartite-type tricarboxylate transporter receptor subunit TctC